MSAAFARGWFREKPVAAIECVIPKAGFGEPSALAAGFEVVVNRDNQSSLVANSTKRRAALIGQVYLELSDFETRG